jgi:hypothetical protein
MRYPDEHWQRVADLYRSVVVTPSDVTGGKTEHTVRVAKVQDHYPATTTGTVATWVRRCQRMGLL